MTKIEFTVDRKREGCDDGPQKVKCFAMVEDTEAKKICYDFDEDYDACEKSYNRFCDRVPRIVKDQTGYECGYEWWFDRSPKIAA
jgi:hypothetical protein